MRYFCFYFTAGTSVGKSAKNISYCNTLGNYQQSYCLTYDKTASKSALCISMSQVEQVLHCPLVVRAVFSFFLHVYWLCDVNQFTILCWICTKYTVLYCLTFMYYQWDFMLQFNFWFCLFVFSWYNRTRST